MNLKRGHWKFSQRSIKRVKKLNGHHQVDQHVLWSPRRRREKKRDRKVIQGNNYQKPPESGEGPRRPEGFQVR